MTIGHAVGKRIHFLRYVSDLNQSQLAVKAGVPQSVISRLERGEGRCSPEHAGQAEMGVSGELR